MKKIFLMMVVFYLSQNLYAQTTSNLKSHVIPFFNGDNIPDLPLTNLANYKNTTVSLSEFGDKLIILDFWSIHCSGCIENFKMEDSIQQLYKDKLQFILVTMDPKDKVISFFNRYDSLNNVHFSIPSVCSDSVLVFLFRHHSLSQYEWLAPDGSYFAQTGDELINAQTISVAINKVLGRIQEMKKSGFPDNMIHFHKTPPELLEAFKQNNLIKTFYK